MEDPANLQTVLEAVGGRLVAAVSVLLPPFAEEQGPLVQEQMPLHGLEAGQLLHARGAPLVADPHAERALHQHAAQLADVALSGELCHSPPRPPDTDRRGPDLVARDGRLMHGVVDRFQKVQHGCQRPLEFSGALAVCAIFEKLLKM